MCCDYGVYIFNPILEVSLYGLRCQVRVPARADGSCLLWEFATDSCDLGFGVSFEWGPPARHEVTVEVSDPSQAGQEGSEAQQGEERG